MKHLMLVFFSAVSAYGQLFPATAARFRAGDGSPAVGECTAAADTNRVWVDRSAVPTVLYVCRQTSAGVFAWDVIDTASGSLDGDLQEIAALTCSSGQTLADNAGAWTCKTLAKGDVGLGNVDNTSNATERAATATLTNKTLSLPIIGTYTAAGLPSAGTLGRIAVMTDSTDGTCVTSGGSTRVWCFDTGSTWASLTGGAGSSYTPSTYCVPTISSGNLLISTPCKVLIGTKELTFGSNMTFDGSSGTGTVYFGIQAGVAKAWHNVTASCTNCTAVGSATDFPADACALASATVTSGTVSDPVNLRQGRACAVLESSSTATVTADPSTGAATVDLALSGTPNELTVAAGAVSLHDNAKVPTCADAGSNDTYACSASPAPTAYVTGGRYVFKANTVNTGAATVNFNSLGAKTIKKFTSASPGADLADNDIRAGQWVHLIYDGTNMQMVSPLGNAAAAAQTTRTLIESFWCQGGNNARPAPWATFTFTGFTETVVSAANWYSRCGLQVETAANDNEFDGWRVNSSGTTQVSFTNMPAGGSTRIVYEFATGSVTAMDVFLRADGASDLGSGPADSPANTVGFRRLSGGNWFVQWCVASSCSTSDTGVALAASTEYRMTLTIPQTGSWSWSIESGPAYATVTSGTAAGSRPTTDLLPIFQVRADGAVLANAKFRYYKLDLLMP